MDNLLFLATWFLNEYTYWRLTTPSPFTIDRIFGGYPYGSAERQESEDSELPKV